MILSSVSMHVLSVTLSLSCVSCHLVLHTKEKKQHDNGCEMTMSKQIGHIGYVSALPSVRGALAAFKAWQW